MSSLVLYSTFSLVYKKMTLTQFFDWSKKYPDFYEFKRNLSEHIDSKKIPNDWFESFLRILDYYFKNRIEVIYPGHPNYPESFKNLKDQPLHLAVRGCSSALNTKCISVVGSRYPSEDVKKWLDSELPKICKSGYTIVSGAARGVDQRAHMCSIRTNSPTIAFVPSGLSQIYPYEFVEWEKSILDSGGAIISEYSPFQSVMPFHFQQRNRMIAVLGLITFIAQARKKSGSTLTGRLAMENSKTICVLPSFPGNPFSDGSLDFIFMGAFPIRDGEDLLTLLEAEAIKKNHFFQMSLNT